MSYYKNNHIANYKGRTQAIKFFDAFCERAIHHFKRYFDCLPGNLKEHGFEYTEQRTKTYLTLALGDVSKGYFMQEHPADRKILNNRGRHIDDAKARMDYWAVVGRHSYLIEVKEAWIRYKGANRFTFHHYIGKRLEDAMDQIDTLSERKMFNFQKRMFSLGLVVCPIYYRIPKNDPKLTLRLNSKVLETLEKKARAAGSNIFYLWSLPQKYLRDDDPEGDCVYNVLGLIFIGKIKKLTKN